MLDISMIWFTAAVPVAFVLILVHASARLALRFCGQSPDAQPPKS
jgi:TRAP-type C4-dicarboxylate transport system permease small subunit